MEQKRLRAGRVGALCAVLVLAGGPATASTAGVGGSGHVATEQGTAATPPPFVATVAQPPGCLVVGPTIVGVKVFLIQKALGLVGHHEIYDRATVAAVKRFQRVHHLVADGLVGPRTWAALRTGQDFCLDRYTAQPTVPPAASSSAHAAAMTAFAKGGIGLPYVWGGAGPIGYDCSGLALQSLHAGGRVLPGFTTDDHVRGDFNTAAAIYASKALTHVPLSKRRPGDLVFWGNDFHHMAIYLGGDRIVEAVRPSVHTASLWSHGDPLPTVARPAG